MPAVRRLALLLLAAACAHAPPPPPVTTPAPAAVVDPAPAVPPPSPDGASASASAAASAPEPPVDQLTLERTACSGACPVYVLTLGRDGRVHFDGRADVGSPGERDWRMDPVFARHLFSEFERSGFLALKGPYPTEVEEFPGLVLTLRRAGQVHRVQLGGEGTADLERDLAAERLLQRLALTVDKLTGSGRFTEVGSKKKGAGCVD